MNARMQPLEDGQLLYLAPNEISVVRCRRLCCVGLYPALGGVGLLLVSAMLTFSGSWPTVAR